MKGFNNKQGACQGGGRSHRGGRGGRRGGCANNTYMHAPGGIPQYVPPMGGPQQNYIPVSTTVALSRLLRGDRQPAEAAAETWRTRTNTNYLTTGTSVIPMVLMSRTATIQPHAETGRWIIRRGSHVTMHRHTSMKDTRR
jgi:hypothetical protein